jgi:amidohydrolase
MASRERIASLAEGVVSKTVELRRLLHRHPEPAYEEHQTTALIAATLDENGVVYQERKPKTGLWFDIGGDARVAFRADLDALPITEPEDNVPRSQNPGWMHACGHDAHAAIAFGVALVLRQMELPVGVRFLFQPAEESFPGGAVEFVDDGLVNGLKGIMAFHVDPSLETGKVGARIGAVTASADKFTIDLTGPGGHTARPHQTVDLIADAARVVHELPAYLRRTIDARSPLTMVFGSIHGGSAGNVIPTRVKLRGTVRTLDRDLWEVLPGLVDKAIGTLLAMTGAEYDLDYQAAIPPVVNDETVIGAVTAGISEVLGEEAIVHTEPSMGGEDFANYLATVPGALVRLGTSSSSTGNSDLHSPSFTLDEATIGIGIRSGVGAVLSMLDRL